MVSPYQWYISPDIACQEIERQDRIEERHRSGFYAKRSDKGCLGCRFLNDLRCEKGRKPGDRGFCTSWLPIGDSNG